MMRKQLTLLTALILTILTPGMAQWSYIQDDPAIQAVANTLAEDADGNIIAAGGGFGYPLGGDGPVRVTKLDVNGNLIWETEITSPAGVGPISASSVAIADDGYIIFCSGFDRPLVVKLNFDGTIAWSNEAWTAGLALGICPDARGAVLSDGTIVMVSLDSSVPTQIKIFLMEEDGDLISEVTHPVTIDGNLIISAWDLASHGDGFAISGGGFDAGFNFMPYICKFDMSGDVEWMQLYSDFAPMESYGICTTADGGYAISSYDFFAGQTSLIKVDAGGNQEWGNIYAATDAANFYAYAYDLAQRTDGTYAMLHVNLDFWYLHSGDIEVLLIDETGVETDRIIAAAGLGNRANKMIATADGGYAFAGEFTLDDIDMPEYDWVYMVQKSSPTGELPACIYNCVWPGDADNNGVANADDILTLGVLAGTSGAVRDDMSIDWYAHAAEAWAGNEQYADCNGDGTINEDDTTAVSLNYSNEHAVYTLKEAAGDILLSIITPDEALVPGAYAFPLELGDAINYPEAIYGLRFTITYEGNDLDLSSVTFNFGDNWLGNSDNEIRFRKNMTDVQELDVAIVRNDQNNTTGYGEIGELGFVVIDNIAGRGRSESILFNITDIRAIDVDMNEVEIMGSAVSVESESTDLTTLEGPGMEFFPNPVSGTSLFYNLNGLNLPESIQITDMSGKILRVFGQSELLNGSLDISELPAGAYITEILWSNQVQAFTLVVQ